MLKGKKIVLGITGSIAAYKSCLIIRGLIKRGAEVQVVITPAGKEFITPITLSALTHKPVVSEFFSQRDGTWNSHVDLGLWADAMLIAPCTASTMGKMAHGIADNMLITTYLSMKAPVFIAPAMDLDMYKHPSTQANMKTLLGYGNHIIEPEVGFLASGLEGKGRMEEPDIIVECLDRFFDEQAQQNAETDEAASENCKEKESDKLDLKGKKIMITAGPTYEKIDPVRFIGNYSSGKMGFALAEECCRRGAEVTLVAGPVILLGVIVAFIVAGMVRRVNVYDAFIEGAKEGFQTAVRIIPYLVAILVAVGVFRASGAMDRLIDGISWLVAQCGLNTDFVGALPTAFMKPLSGSGARGLMLEAMQNYGPDSFVGRLSCIFQGSTDTTFYVLAVYFGSVSVKYTRHAVAAGLLADLAGVVAAIAIAYIFFA